MMFVNDIVYTCHWRSRYNVYEWYSLHINILLRYYSVVDDCELLCHIQNDFVKCYFYWSKITGTWRTVSVWILVISYYRIL
jgi:hypothetical protein